VNRAQQLLLQDAWPLAERIADYLCHQSAVNQAEVAGSIRRRMEVVGTIDIVAASSVPAGVLDSAVQMPGVNGIISRNSSSITVSLNIGIELNVYAVKPEHYPWALQYYTGSREHNRKLARFAKSRGMNYPGDCLQQTNGNVPLVQDEPAVYKVLGLSYIEPELREGQDEIEQAAHARVPRLVTAGDIQGGLHVHTAYSDGRSDIASLAAAAKAMGWRYLGISDHSQSAHYAGGLKIDAIIRQRREIDKLNERFGILILAGIESDILPDGSLDYSDDVLAQFDFVIASVHSAFRQSEGAMTKRIIKAMHNRYVSILGHATGRLLLKRPGYALDLPAVIQTAAQTGTILEINANPRRLDLDWRWCRQAKEQGVVLAINPDAHDVQELSHMRYGLAVARKGWLTAYDVANTRHCNEIQALLQRKRK